MSPAPPSKRRRLDSANHTLSQPFKSPFKTPSKPTTIPREPTSTPKPTTHVPTLPSSTQESTTPTTSNPHQTPSLRRPLRPLPAAPSSPHLLALRTRTTHLQNALTTVRASLDTHRQALALETSSTDAELHDLITKWKAASRAAAEEVFGGVRDRVNRMGGVGAWRGREREKREGGFGGGWGWEGAGEGGGSAGGGEDGEGGSGDEKGEEEMEGMDGEKKEEEQEDDDEGFTMDMMLKSLNIELDIIGFDKKEQRWID